MKRSPIPLFVMMSVIARRMPKVFPSKNQETNSSSSKEHLKIASSWNKATTYGIMSYPIILLGAALCAIAVSHPALANEENISPALPEQNRAAVLVTQPASISNGINLTNRTNHLKKVSESIGVVSEQACKKISPLELIKDPRSSFKQCLEDRKKQADQINQTSEPTEKFEFFKIPALESGINVTVTKF